MKTQDENLEKTVTKKLSELKKLTADKKQFVISNIISFLSGLEVGANLKKLESANK